MRSISAKPRAAQLAMFEEALAALKGQKCCNAQEQEFVLVEKKTFLEYVPSTPPLGLEHLLVECRWEVEAPQPQSEQCCEAWRNGHKLVAFNFQRKR